MIFVALCTIFCGEPKLGKIDEFVQIAETSVAKSTKNKKELGKAMKTYEKL